jgi:hypothetical protein
MDYDNRSNTTFKSWNPQSDKEWDNGPCGKCHPQGCLEEYNGYTVWQCCHGSWFLERESRQICVNEPHDHTECPGNCHQHPLLEGAYLEMVLRMRAAGPSCTTWGDIMWEEEQAKLAAETPAERKSRLEAEAEHERKGKQEIVKYLVHRKEEKWTKGGEMKFRVPRPCKYATLFAQRTCANCSAHVPVGQTHCQAMKGHLVCGQELAGCWNHEQTRTCIYVHPDEAQWADACSGVLCYDRQAACFHLRGAEPAQANRFTVAARQDGFRPQSREGAQRHGVGGAGGGAPPRHTGGGGGGAAGGGGRAYQSHGKGARQDDGWEQVPRRR